MLSLVTDINADKHCGLRDFLAEAHAPEIASNFSVHLPDDVHEDAIIVLCDSAISHKLRDYWCLTIDLILQERIEVLVVRVIWHDDEENELRLCPTCDMRLDPAVVIELDALCKRFQQFVFV